MKSSTSVSHKKCISCGNVKPVNRFNSSADSTCKICRGLMQRKIIISSLTNITKNTFFMGKQEITCVTCGKVLSQDMFPKNSYECSSCNDLRHIMEAHRLEGKPLDIVCVVCNEIKDVSVFPYGTFICKTCIAKTNRYKRRVE